MTRTSETSTTAAVTPGDPRYDDLTRRGNTRFVGRPAAFRVVTSTEEVVAAVQYAVDNGHRVVARSGGHCMEDFTDHPDVHTVIDLSLMNRVDFDDARGAFVVEPGGSLAGVYRALDRGWGVTIPAGLYPGVGVGGHVAGGGYGYLSRSHGLAADHLHAVEVVVVDGDGVARAVVATREDDDPHRELWWAHTGGGGGTFGIVTKYWMRSPDARGTDPAQLLPASPGDVLRFSVEWSWDAMDERSFTRLVANHGHWCARESGPDSRFLGMHSEFYLWRSVMGTISLDGVMVGEGAEDLLREHLADLTADVAAPHSLESRRVSWLSVTGELPGGHDSRTARMKVKDAYLRRPLTEEQIATIYRHLTRDDVPVYGGAVSLHTYGGAVNARDTDATATAQRDSVLKLVPIATWGLEGEGEEEHLGWLREVYHDVFADTGGVPVPGDATDGAYVNHCDRDLADPRWNTSGVPWSTLYFKDNYSRLQHVKRDWDPTNVFHHALAVRPT
ncbi:FAD-dependent oxidoreductase [Spiractinospora alimapuensis]|uniref:FAD-dependent oxidoreductase n=1 Tax=Spiractinospora alimapuensis TaxID=2820884 RepID=UPI001F3EEED9|nr:FAD-binding protein [Spiractinospora alimapuensis]QVQ52911.1 FAD-dependent oxidoreductase [Spiractinospora alimapuensis]